MLLQPNACIGPVMRSCLQVYQPTVSTTGRLGGSLLSTKGNCMLLKTSYVSVKVLLAYGIRKPLQRALRQAQLDLQSAMNPGRSDRETAQATMETYLEVRKLLEELDVADDSTSLKIRHTHAKFRQCFGLAPRPGQLQVKGPLHVPRE